MNTFRHRHLTKLLAIALNKPLRSAEEVVNVYTHIMAINQDNNFDFRARLEDHMRRFNTGKISSDHLESTSTLMTIPTEESRPAARDQSPDNPLNDGAADAMELAEGLNMAADNVADSRDLDEKRVSFAPDPLADLAGSTDDKVLEELDAEEEEDKALLED